MTRRLHIVSNMAPTPIVTPNGPRIREVRELRGWTPGAFAKMTGRHPQTIWDVEHNRRNVSLTIVRQFAGALSSNPDEAQKLLAEFILVGEPDSEDDVEAEPLRATA